MGFLSKLFGSKREPEWFDVGEVGDGFVNELKHHAQLILHKKGKRGSVPTIVSEPLPGYFKSPQELQSHVFETLADFMAMMPPEAREAMARGNVFFIISHTSKGQRHIALVVMEYPASN